MMWGYCMRDIYRYVGGSLLYTFYRLCTYEATFCYSIELSLNLECFSTHRMIPNKLIIADPLCTYAQRMIMRELRSIALLKSGYCSWSHRTLCVNVTYVYYS